MTLPNRSVLGSRRISPSRRRPQPFAPSIRKRINLTSASWLTVLLDSVRGSSGLTAILCPEQFQVARPSLARCVEARLLALLDERTAGIRVVANPIRLGEHNG
jgi:hypothetical protein